MGPNSLLISPFLAALISYVLHMIFPYKYPEQTVIESEEETRGGSESDQTEQVIEETKVA